MICCKTNLHSLSDLFQYLSDTFNDMGDASLDIALRGRCKIKDDDAKEYVALQNSLKDAENF